MNVLRKPQGCRAVWGSSHSQGWISAADRRDTAQSASWGFSGPKLQGRPPGCRDGWKLLHSEGASMLVVLTTPYASALSSFQCLLSCFCPHRWRWQSLYIILSVWVRSVSWFHWKKKKKECAKWLCSPYCFVMISRRIGEKCWLTKLCLHWCLEAFKFQTYGFLFVVLLEYLVLILLLHGQRTGSVWYRCNDFGWEFLCLSGSSVSLKRRMHFLIGGCRVQYTLRSWRLFIVLFIDFPSFNYFFLLILSFVDGSGGSVAKLCPTLGTPWTVACQAPLYMGFPRQEYWSGLPFSSLEDVPNPGIEPGSPELQVDSLPTEPPGKSISCVKRVVLHSPPWLQIWLFSL